MEKMTIRVAALLGALGIGFFLYTGRQHPTSLIPLWFGIVLGICGLLSNTQNAKQRMIWAHVAVTVALVGFVVPVVRLLKASSANTTAGLEQGLMAGICFGLTALYVNSFIAARKARG